MEEVKIHSGTRIKLKRIDEEYLPSAFIDRLKAYAHKEERIQAIFVFAIETETHAEQPSMAIALKSGSLFSKKDEGFLQVVDEIQMALPDGLPVNLYRFGASELLATYCVNSLEPLYLRSSSWLDKQRKKYPPSA